MEKEVPSSENLSGSQGLLWRVCPALGERKLDADDWATTNINEEGNICASAQEHSTLPLQDKGWEYLLIAAAWKKNSNCLNI